MPPPRFFRTTFARVGVCVLLGLGAPATGQALSEAPPFEPSSVRAASNDSASESSILVTAELEEPAAAVAEEPAERLPSPRESLLASLREQHAWARYDPGAWRRLQVLSEAFDAEGTFVGRSLTEHTERLIDVDEESYTLSVESTVELAGRRTTSEPKEQRYSLLTDRPFPESAPTLAEGEPVSISLGGVLITCRVWRLGVAGEADDDANFELLYVADDGVPRLLRRERSLALAGQSATRHDERVTQAGAPAEYGGALVKTWHSTGEMTQPSGARSERFAVHASEPPGGLLQESVVEHDAEGNRSRWATTRLIESGRTPKERVETTSQGAEEKALEVRPRRLLRMLRRGGAVVEE